MCNQKFKDVTVSEVIKDCEGVSLGKEVFLLDDFSRVKDSSYIFRMRCLVMSLCLEGECGYSVDTTEHCVRPNDIIIIRKGQTISNCWQSPDYKGLLMAFSYNFFDEAIKGMRGLSSLFLFAKNHSVCNLEQDEADRLKEYYRIIKETVTNDKLYFRRETIQSLIAAMLYDISSVVCRMQKGNVVGSRAERIFMDFIHIVEKKFRQERRVGWYSEQLGLSPKYLSETVKSVSGRTPNEWIDYYVMLELRVRLRNTEATIKEITQDMNFSSQSFLGKYFKEHAGMSPLEYRKSIK